jgi:2-polyprenyl-3-methyl-5-hydroxy-6-metoxy-1,4-benzoquinol methylase
MAIEAVAAQAAIARVDHGYDRVIDGFFPEDLPEEEGPFDLVCFNDVLEHVIDPWQMVSDTRSLLTPDGVIMASIPSIQFFPVVLQLLRGRWDYHDAGTLDRTHLRFFTRITMVEMFENADFTVIGCHGINDLAVSWLPGASRVRGTARKLAIRSMRDARYMRFVILATQAE